MTSRLDSRPTGTWTPGGREGKGRECGPWAGDRTGDCSGGDRPLPLEVPGRWLTCWWARAITPWRCKELWDAAGIGLPGSLSGPQALFPMGCCPLYCSVSSFIQGWHALPAESGHQVKPRRKWKHTAWHEFEDPWKWDFSQKIMPFIQLFPYQLDASDPFQFCAVINLRFFWKYLQYCVFL